MYLIQPQATSPMWMKPSLLSYSSRVTKAPKFFTFIRDYIREGQKVVCKVLKVDKEKGHIDLSLKAVNEHQRREKIQEWKNEQKAENLFAIVAQRLGKTVDECWQEFG